MDYKILAVSSETDDFTQDDLSTLKTMCGKDAGICYQRGTYFNTSVSDPKKATNRFNRVVKMGHHSIADHVQIKVYLENVSKMTAIILNSLQYYATSEKSGKYTVMTGNSDEEKDLYDKWKVLFRNRILQLKPDIDDKMLTELMAKNGHDDVIITNGKLNNNTMVDDDEVHQMLLVSCKSNQSLPSVRLAQENARYVLSVFTYSVSLSYTTSLRQWNYIYDWCLKYCSQYTPKTDEEYIKAMSGGSGKVTILRKADNSECSYFEERLYYDLLSLSNFIYDNLYVDDLRDTKDRCFDFLTNLSGKANHPMSKYDFTDFEHYGKFAYTDTTYSSDDVVDTVYSIAYPASFVYIAQAERHRTLKYFMLFNPDSDVYDFFVPPMLRGTDLEQEWLNDLNSVKHLVPQATKVGIVETGHISDFILKCKERLCGRAQWETMNRTSVNARRFIDYVDNNNVSDVFKSYVDQLRGSYSGLRTKGDFGSCREDCVWGCSHGLDRPF